MLDEVCQREGYLLESGWSYHFHWRDLMPEDFWRRFMETIGGYAIDSKFIVDYNFVFESTETCGFSVLRLSANMLKQEEPRITAKIEDNQLSLFSRS